MSQELELNEDGTPKVPVKIELTPEQQEHVNKIINERFAKIAEKHAKEKEEYAAKKLKEAEDARKEAEGNNNNNNNGNPPKPEENEQQRQFRELLDNEKNRTKQADEARKRAEADATAAKEESLNVRKTQAIYNALGKQNFYQPEDVLNLTQGKIVYDSDSKTFVVKEGGVIRQNSSLQNMTLEEFYSEVAASRPYLVNGELKGGVGSRESSSGSTTSNGLVKSKADLKTAKDKSDWITKFGFEKYQALPLS